MAMTKAGRFTTALTLSAALLAATGAAAQDKSGIGPLVQQAEFWDGKQRNDLSREAWQRVLQADPKHEKALGRLAALERQAGHGDEAQRYLDQLRQIAPKSTWLDQTKAQNSTSDAPLPRARELARQKRGAEALAAYEQSFVDGKPPSDAVALEYYETMSGVDARYDEARKGLAALAERSGDGKARFAYARVLSYRAATRRDAVSRLRELAGDPQQGTEAKKAWRQSLIWLQPGANDAPLYTAYLEAVGGDAEIEKKLQQVKQARSSAADSQAAETAGAELKAAFDALNANELDAAETGFQRLLAQRAGNADARAGLGLVRLRQQRFEDAAQLFDDAVRAKPGLQIQYGEARSTALFWSRARRAEAAVAAGENGAALSEYRSALMVPPPGGVDPSVSRNFAALLLKSGQDAEAETVLRDALASHPQEPGLLGELATLLTRTGRGTEARQLLAGAPEQTRTELRVTEAEVAREDAAKLIENGRNKEAEQRLREALAAQPESPWIRLDLSRLYRKMGRDADAEALLNSMVEASTDSSQGWLAHAHAYAESQRWYEALAALENLPPADRIPQVRALQREAWVRYQVQRATAAARKGDPGHAAEWLGAAIEAAGDEPSLASALAQGWAALGDPARAVAVLRRSFAGREPSIDDRIQYAALLLQIDQDAEFEAFSTALVQRGGLSVKQSATLEDLVVGYRIKLADRERERGDFAAAYRQLREVVARYPSQPRVQMALARLFVSGGEPDKALAISRSLMRQPEPSDEVLLASIDSALAAQQTDTAGKWIDLAFKRKTQPVAAHRAAARLAELRGNEASALGHYREAEQLAKQENALSAAPPALALIDSSNGQVLPDSLRDAVQTADVPVGPLLPRAPDDELLPQGATATARSMAPVDGYRGLDPRAPGELPTSTRVSETPLLAVNRDAHAPARDSEWAPPYDPDTINSLDRLQGQVAGWTLGGFTSRNRDGEAGLSRLYNLETSIDWVTPAWRAGRLGIRVRPSYLDAGALSGRDKLRYGTLALVNAETPDRSLSDSGIAFGIGYQLGSFSVDVGTTPLGFQIENLLGGLLWQPQFGPISVSIDLSRRSVTDSLLSYAGAYDPLTGKRWGGVSKSGGRLDLAYDLSVFGLYINGGFFAYDGRNVEQNTQFEFGGGLFFRALRRETQTLTIGVNVTTFGYDKNLRYFTFGHGGYFSPEYFGALTLPISYTGRYGLLSYRFDAAFGLQSFRENGMPLYPGRESLQNEVEELAQFEPTAQIPTGYGPQKNTGLSYSAGGQAQYRFTERLVGGGALSVDNARDYREFVLTGFLRWYFSGVQLVPDQPNPPRLFKGVLP